MKDSNLCNLGKSNDSSLLIIPEWAITKIAWNSTKPEILITALVLFLYEKLFDPKYCGVTPIWEGYNIERRFKKDQLKRAYNRLAELGILKKEGKKFIVPWLEGER